MEAIGNQIRVTCPYCDCLSQWLAGGKATGYRVTECEQCGELFVTEIRLAPKLVSVYRIQKVEENPAK